MSFIEPRQAYTYFNKNYHIKKTSKGWYAFKCPFCDELENRKKAAVNFQFGMVKCWICGYKQNVIDFVSDTEGVTYKAAKDILKECTASDVILEEMEDNSHKVYSEIKLPYGYKSILEGDGALGKRARNYLSGRGFDLKALDRMGVGYCSEILPDNLKDEEDDYFGYIILPFKSRGVLVYYIGRDFIGNFLRYKNPKKEQFNVGKSDLIFNEDALYLYDEVFVLEGALDAMTVGREAVSTQGWNWSATQKSKIINSDAEIITLVPDGGVDGRGVPFYVLALELACDIAEHKLVKVVNLNKIEAGKDVNAIGKDAFMEVYNKCEPMSQMELITQIFDYE